MTSFLFSEKVLKCESLYLGHYHLRRYVKLSELKRGHSRFIHKHFSLIIHFTLIQITMILFWKYVTALK